MILLISIIDLVAVNILRSVRASARVGLSQRGKCLGTKDRDTKTYGFSTIYSLQINKIFIFLMIHISMMVTVHNTQYFRQLRTCIKFETG